MNWQKLQWIDVRILYVIILLCLLIPMFKPIGLPVSISENTRKVFEAIESLPDGSVIWVSHDTGPGNAPELNPMISAVARQAFRKNCKIIATSFFNEMVGPALTQEYIESVAKEMGKEYGVDWINLGYRVNASPAILQLLIDDINKAMSGVDWKGEPLDKFPIMKEVKSIRNDVDLIFVTTVGTPGYGDWMTYVAEPLGKPLTGGASLTMYSGLQQYIRSGQLKGFLGGLRGAAEYEQLLKAPGKGLAGMDAQSLGHLTVIIFLILGNIGYFASRKKA
ncbi:MAG: hypothetical protein IMF26_05305 [Candidatus Fermentithermobacillus carboniphilus]|uniref:Uncharacterized protein n=1 Tax=Candidatus Fermentithermobacillus carboniphilus TaxID=3085328 RepID=A0AAT9LEH0_9FIRM|nr:MAG: hypothetical protein IMF26_05305 [Candidatus Fermentithermobacillus carboniphilus]